MNIHVPLVFFALHAEILISFQNIKTLISTMFAKCAIHFPSITEIQIWFQTMNKLFSLIKHLNIDFHNVCIMIYTINPQFISNTKYQFRVLTVMNFNTLIFIMFAYDSN